MTEVETFATLIQQTITPESEESFQQASDQILQIINTPGSIEVFIALFSLNTVSEAIKRGALIYIEKILKSHWNDINQAAVKEWLSRSFSPQIPPSFILSISHLISLVYQLDEQSWPELIGVLQSSYQQVPILSSSIFSEISGDINSEFFVSNFEHFLEILQFYLTFPNQLVQSNGLSLFAVILSHIEDFDEVQSLLQPIVLIAQNSGNLITENRTEESLTLFSKIWNSISTITTQQLPIEFSGPLIETAIQFASSTVIPSNARQAAAIAVVNGVHAYDQPLESILQILIDICAQSISENNVLPFEDQIIFENLLNCRAHSETYPVFVSVLFQGLNSESQLHIAASLLAVRALLSKVPELAQRDAANIASLINQGIESEDPLLIQCAGAVTELFGGAPSYAACAPQLLRSLIPYCAYTGENENEVRHHALKGCVSLADTTDCSINDILQIVWNLREAIDDKDKSLYFILPWPIS